MKSYEEFVAIMGYEEVNLQNEIDAILLSLFGLDE